MVEYYSGIAQVANIIDGFFSPLPLSFSLGHGKMLHTDTV